MKTSIPALDDDRVLRNVLLGNTGYRLLLWDTYKTKWNKSLLGYALYEPGKDAPLFTGEEYGCAPGHAIDSDEALRALLGFLTLRPGDTDPEYFAEYTEAQRAFCDGDAEELSQWAFEESDVDRVEEWRDYCCFVDAS